MKKLIALLLAAMLMFGTMALAETAADDEVTVGEPIEVTDSTPTTLKVDDLLDFALSMDSIPEGYTFNTYPIDGCLYADFSKDADSVMFLASVAYSEEFDGYTLNLEALTADETAAMQEMVGAQYNAPSFSYTKTSHGTDVIVINENGADSDYAEFVTIYQGYFISICAVKTEDLTEDDLAMALKLMSDMWIVPAA